MATASHAAPAVLSTADGIATITLNRPEVLNALNAAMVSRLHALAAEVETDETIRAVTIRGAGDAFMAGGDIAQFRHFVAKAEPDAAPDTQPDTQPDTAVEPGTGGSAAFADLLGQVNAIVMTIRRMLKPVVAVVDGPAAGFGVSLALACDMVVASSRASFTTAYMRLGTTPDGGITRHLPMVAGRQAAFELLALSDTLDAEAARRHGLVNRVVPPEDLDTTADAIARRLAALPTAAIGRTKALIDNAGRMPLGDHLDAEARAFLRSTESPDFREGVHAFLEKRRPRFSGA